MEPTEALFIFFRNQYLQNWIKKFFLGNGEMDQQPRAIVTLAEDPGFVISNIWDAHKFSCRGSDAPSEPRGHQAHSCCIYTHAGKALIHIK